MSAIDKMTQMLSETTLTTDGEEEEPNRSKRQGLKEMANQVDEVDEVRNIWSQDQATKRFIVKLCWILEDLTNFRATHGQHFELLHLLEKLIFGFTKTSCQVINQGHVVHALCLYKRAPKKEVLEHPSTERIYMIFLISLIITCKDLFDDYYQTYVWTPFCNYSVSQLNTMERRFLRICDYQILVNPKEYDSTISIFV